MPACNDERSDDRALERRLDRRTLFARARDGLALATFAGVAGAGSLASPRTNSDTGASASPRDHAARAKRVLHICLCGGLSQVDSFDYKPALARYHGKSLQGDERPDVFFGQVGLLRRSDWSFRRRGQSGKWVSDLFPHLGGVVDELTFVHSMVADTSNHTPATFQENTGFRLNGFPVLGAWLSRGLDSEADDLPAYVVIPDARGYPAGGTINWTNGFLPAEHQGVVIRSAGTPIDALFPARPIEPGSEQAVRELIRALNARHLEARGARGELVARANAHALARRMQRSVPEVADLERESAATRALYGLEEATTADFGRGCLLARRLLERGVRCVQLFAGGSFGSPRINWDGHEDMRRNHGREAARIDRPVAALLIDLKRRGLLEDTLVLFTSEFGRTPFTQSAADVVGTGRDHNQYGFTIWMAGGGLRAGSSHGATDELGWKAVQDVVTWPDLHATILHLVGLDHERLTYYHNGIERRLTNVSGGVLHALLA